MAANSVKNAGRGVPADPKHERSHDKLNEPLTGTLAAPGLGTKAEPPEDAGPPAHAGDDPVEADRGKSNSEADEPHAEDLGIVDVGADDIELDPEWASMTSAPILKAGEMSEEDREFQRHLEDHGLQDPLDGWRKDDGRVLLVKGYRRLLFCRELGIAVRVRLFAFTDRDAATEFRLRSCSGRRSSTDTERRYNLGRRYNLMDKRQGQRNDLTTGHGAQKSVALQLAELVGCDERTVRRNGAFAKAIDKLARANPDFRRLLLAEQIKIPQPVLEKLTEGVVDRMIVNSIVETKKYTPAEPVKTKAADPLRPILNAWRGADWQTRGSFLLGILDDQDDVEVLEKIGVIVTKK